MTQPPPKKTGTPEVWPMVIETVTAGTGADGMPAYWRQRLAARMEKRHRFGVEKYGVGLQVENGRDPLEDCMDEALDGCAYSRQQWERSRHPEDWETCEAFLRLAGRLLWRMEMRKPEADES